VRITASRDLTTPPILAMVRDSSAMPDASEPPPPGASRERVSAGRKAGDFAVPVVGRSEADTDGLSSDTAPSLPL
jgi:hypothetical protein